jgi:hypothetical protein
MLENQKNCRVILMSKYLCHLRPQQNITKIIRNIFEKCIYLRLKTTFKFTLHSNQCYITATSLSADKPIIFSNCKKSQWQFWNLGGVDFFRVDPTAPPQPFNYNLVIISDSLCNFREYFPVRVTVIFFRKTGFLQNSNYKYAHWGT